MRTEESSRTPDAPGPSPGLEAPHALTAEAVARHQDLDPGRGLEESEAARRHRRYGPNQLRSLRPPGALHILANQFKSLIVLLLAIAAAVAFAFDEVLDGSAILVVLVLNALIGFTTEFRAIRSMEALRKMGQVTSRVRRGGRDRTLPAEDLVPGDLVLVEAGDVVTADLRLAESAGLQVDESALTGESVPVIKSVDPVSPEAPLAERHSMLFKGTALNRGTAAGVVVATGMDTELGRIARLVHEAEDTETPLEERLARLGHRLIWVTLALATLTSGVGIAAGRPMLLMIETGIALAVAAIPEGLPIVATMALARGMWRMARRNALINRLSAVETLGSTTVIMTDKTGTLTENRMTVEQLWLPDGTAERRGGQAWHEPGDIGAAIDPEARPTLRHALRIAALCNNASLPAGGEATGDPLEIALLEAAHCASIDRQALDARYPRLREEAFDARVRMMATLHRDEASVLVAVKGAAENVVEECRFIRGEGGDPVPLDTAGRERWLAANEQLAERGYRVLALACRRTQDEPDAVYQELEFLGLVGLVDPPRPEVAGAIAACHDAGIRVVMATGDQAATARNVARETGLVTTAASDTSVLTGAELAGLGELGPAERRQVVNTPVFSRVSPEQKLDLVALWQAEGAVVAMTGDGVNDAPALKKADIGIAMGRRGTQVAREASDMVLVDDSFASIAAAVGQGRVIFDNIRRFVVYLLSCNISEIMVVTIASATGSILPLLPLQILFLNLVTDVFPALALGFGQGDEGVLRRPPRPTDETIVTRRGWKLIIAFGALIAASVLLALGLAQSLLGLDETEAVTVSFLTLALAQLWHVFNLRDADSRLLANDIVRSAWVWGALLICIGLLLAAVSVPALQQPLRTRWPDGPSWLLILGASLLPLLLGQIGLWLHHRRMSETEASPEPSGTRGV